MNTTKKSTALWITTFLFIAFFCFTPHSFATTYTASQTGNWSSSSTWGGAGVPGIGDTAIINAAYTVTVDASTTVAAVTMSAGAITQNANLNVMGTYAQSGTSTFTCSSPSTNTFYAYDFQIVTTSGTLYFNRFTGSHTSASPYLIYDVYGLQAVEEELGSTYYYQLAKNIDASGTVNWNGGAGFVPLGNSTTRFAGNFKGAGFTISQLAINLPSTSYVGLFGYASLGSNSIFNLNLTVNNITGYQYVGGLVGRLDSGSGSIFSCSVTVNPGDTVSGTYASATDVGGFVGYNNGTISNSYAAGTGSVGGTSNSYVGGFAGVNNTGHAISNSYNTTNIAANSSISAGFAGGNWGTISNSYSAGSSNGYGFATNYSGSYTNDWFYNTRTDSYATKAHAASDFYNAGSMISPATGGKVYQRIGATAGWNFTTVWIPHYGTYPTLGVSPKAYIDTRAGKKVYVNTTGSNKSTSSIAGPTSGLVGYWSFNGADTNWNTNTTKDLSGNNNTGTLVGMSTTTSPVAGVIGQALNFNGVSGYVTTQVLAFPSSCAYSMSMWMKSNGPVSGILEPLSWGYREFMFYTGSGTHHLAFSSDGSYWDAAIGTSNLDDSKWHFVVGTASGIGSCTAVPLAIYVDGVQQNTATSNVWNGAYNFTIGEGPDGYFNGSIDDVRIYNRALSASEITQFYNLGKAKLNVKL
jgi:hypothetical protein